MPFLKKTLCLAISLSFANGMAHAMSVLEDGDLSDVSGQDGLVVYLDSTSAITATQLDVTNDPGTANEATLRLQGLSLSGVNLTGSSVGGVANPLQGQFTLDVGGNGTDPAVALSLQMQRSRFRVDDVRHLGDTTKSYGTLVLDSPMELTVRNRGGIFNNSGTGAYLKLAFEDANLFYRQLWHQHPVMAFQNMDFIWEVPNGKLGLDTTGLVLQGDTYFKINFDWTYKFPIHDGGEAQEFYISGNEKPLLNFGWEGGLKDAEVRIRTGGMWSGLTGTPQRYNVDNKTGGINFGLRWNYYTSADATAQFPNFRWNVGEGEGSRVRLEFGDWTNLPGVAYGFNFPLIAVDAIRSQQGPGGLCYGGALMGPAGVGNACTGTGRQFIELTPGNVQDWVAGAPLAPAAGVDTPIISLAFRDGNLLSYARTVRVLDDLGLNRSFQWGLIYTLANANGNIFLYPGGNNSDPGGGSLSRGIVADILLMTQSFNETGAIDTWNQGFNFSKGSHFVIADTNPAVNTAIGLVGVSALLASNDMRIMILPNWTAGDHYNAGLDLTSRRTRLNLRGILGGFRLTGADLVQLAGAELNLEGAVNLRLSPALAGQSYLGYSVATRLGAADGTGGAITSGEGSFLSLTEPSRPNAQLKAGSITGDVALVNGKIDLQNASEPGNDRPELVISNDILVGQTARDRVRYIDAGYNYEPFKINNFQFSGQSLGSIVINAGQWYSSITLKPQVP